MTQSEFAYRQGVDYKHYQKIESGRVNMTLETLVKLVSYFDLSLEHFFNITAECRKCTNSWRCMNKDEAYTCLEINRFLAMHEREFSDRLMAQFLKRYGPMALFNEQKKLESAGVMVVQRDSNCKCKWVNNLGTEFFGESLLGSNGHQHYRSREDIEISCGILKEVLLGSLRFKYRELPIQVELSSEKKIVASCVFPCYKSPYNKTSFATYLIFDITDHEKANQKLRDYFSSCSTQIN